MSSLLHVLVSLAPVLAFLGALVILDSYRLVALRSVLLAILAGGGAALSGALLNVALMRGLDLPVETFSRYVAPLSEEILKALYVIFLIKGRRAGFLVDAAIYGFAVGAGFALVENIYYLEAMRGAPLLLWTVRGFGTAVIHGSTTALLAILSKHFADRSTSVPLSVFLPGMALAALVHSLYNHFASLPATLILFVALPLAVVAIYARSEEATRNWLGIGLDTDAELLEILLGHEMADTPIGRHFESLRARFPSVVMVDLVCLMRIHLELSLRAKGILLARKEGADLPITEDVRANLQELRFLEKSVGTTGRLAILPYLSMRGKDLWQLYMLET